jgi:hypothetical protein
VIRIAQRDGLRVTVRPVLDNKSFHGHGWRGTIEPRNRAKWFASYLTFLRPYLKMARSTGSAQFQIGVELKTLTTDPHWAWLIAKAKALFHGIIGYSSNWDLFHEGEIGPLSVTSQGVDVYFTSDLATSAKTDQVAAAWSNWLDGIPPGVDMHKVVITEIGMAAQSRAYRHPYYTGNKSRIIPYVQRRWFTAGCQMMWTWHMAGIYFWYLDLNNPPGTFNPASAPPTSFVGRSSTSIKACFARSVH